MRCVGQVEIEPFCQKVLAKHWPDVWRWNDVKTLTGAQVAQHCGTVDLLCGGFPCQPFSSASAGKRRGKDSDDYLWPEMFRIISEVGPHWVLAENVTHLDGMALSDVVFDLESIGYEVAPVLEIPACAVGHDHRRSRLWICGYTDRDGESGLSVNAKVAKLPKGNCDTEAMGRVDGVSGGLDRLRLTALGNAIVPQVAEVIGRAIMRTFQK